jgi:hypothetical protein
MASSPLCIPLDKADIAIGAADPERPKRTRAVGTIDHVPSPLDPQKTTSTDPPISPWSRSR